MAFSKLATVFALLALGQVNASPTPGPALGRRSDEPICIKRDKPGESLVCSRLGITSNTDGAAEFPIRTDTYELCADLCNETEWCKTFSFNDGQCQMYYSGMDHLGFTAVEEMPKDDKRKPVLWYEMDCFLCENTNWLIAGDDFEDGDISNWAMISDNIEDFFFDVQTANLRNGRSTKVFRIGEASTSGAAEIQHTSRFALNKKDRYQATFFAKADARGAEWASDDFHPITAVVWNKYDTVLEWFPERNGGGLPMGDGWYRFRTQFEVGAGLGGEYVFSFILNASGKEIDWYFDDVSVERFSA